MQSVHANTQRRLRRLGFGLLIFLRWLRVIVPDCAPVVAHSHTQTHTRKHTIRRLHGRDNLYMVGGEEITDHNMVCVFVCA